MTVPFAIAQALADALRTYPCSRVPNYAGQPPDPPCRHCEALAGFDAWMAIVQVPKAPPAGEKP